MLKQFRHEDHNRQAKAQAPDYKEDLLVETIQHSSADNLEERRKDRDYKQHIIESFRTGMFVRATPGGLFFLRLEWTMQQFEAQPDLKQFLTQNFTLVRQKPEYLLFDLRR